MGLSISYPWNLRPIQVKSKPPDLRNSNGQALRSSCLSVTPLKYFFIVRVINGSLKAPKSPQPNQNGAFCDTHTNKPYSRKTKRLISTKLWLNLSNRYGYIKLILQDLHETYRLPAAKTLSVTSVLSCLRRVSMTTVTV